MSNLKEIEEMIHKNVFHLNCFGNNDNKEDENRKENIAKLKNFSKERILMESIKILKEKNHSEEDIEQLLKEKFNLSKDEIEKLIKEVKEESKDE